MFYCPSLGKLGDSLEHFQYRFSAGSTTSKSISLGSPKFPKCGRKSFASLAEDYFHRAIEANLPSDIGS